MEKFLIINADDYGLSPGVNIGIVQAFCARRVSSVSMMVNMPGFEHAVQLARKYPTLDVGLHFNLTYGNPLSSPLTVPSLVNRTGGFSRRSELWTSSDVERELYAQWEKLIASGIHPTHIDSHHHIQKFEVVRNLMISLATDEKISMRRLAPAFAGSSPSSTDYLVPDIYFDSGGFSRLLKNLKKIKPGVTELVCHPGYVDDILLKTSSSWTYVRERELQLLLDPRVKRALVHNHIHLISYFQLND